MLLPDNRYKEVLKSLNAHSLFPYKIVFVRPTPAHPLFRFMLMGTKMKQQQIETKELVIQNERKQYSDSFISLLKDYYLYL